MLMKLTDVDISTTSGRVWAAEHVMQVQAENYLQFNLHDSCLHASLDASAIGRPAEEALALWAWEAKRNVATSMAPQVLRDGELYTSAYLYAYTVCQGMSLNFSLSLSFFSLSLSLSLS